MYFANEYKFYLTYEKVLFTTVPFKCCIVIQIYLLILLVQLMSVRKFIMSQGSSISGSASGVSPLPLDVLIEVDDIVVQFEDDPMEVKLRANYEVTSTELSFALL